MKLAVKKRETLGKKVKNLREEGLVPAELYGKGFDNIHLSVSQKEFSKIIREVGRTTVVDLEIEGEKKNVPTLIYDVQRHPISRDPITIDFYRIKEDEKIQTKVPLEFTGEAPVEKEGEFVVIKVLSEMEIETLPREIPSSIEIDLSSVEEEDDIIHLGDLNLPSGVEIVGDPDTVVISVTEREEEEEEEAAPIMPGELGELGEEGLEGELFEEGEGIPEEVEEALEEGEGEGESS